MFQQNDLSILNRLLQSIVIFIILQNIITACTLSFQAALVEGLEDPEMRNEIPFHDLNQKISETHVLCCTRT